MLLNIELYPTVYCCYIGTVAYLLWLGSCQFKIGTFFSIVQRVLARFFEVCRLSSIFFLLYVSLCNIFLNE